MELGCNSVGIFEVVINDYYIVDYIGDYILIVLYKEDNLVDSI